MKTITDNIRAYYLLSTLHERQQGLDWYDTAYRDCESLAITYDISTQVICGMVAALSPRNRWTRNITDTEQVILLGEDAVVGTFNTNKTKALKILNGASPLTVLSGNKVTAFYKCLVYRVICDDVCVDTHAYGVALGNGERLRPKNISDTKYAEISDDYRELALELGIQPKQLQAITWLTYRRIHKITE